MNMSIFDLMQVPEEAHDLQWLKDSLQAAIKLEFATVPVYLCGMWSVKNQSDPVVGIIRSIVIDEMFHMGLACNMLTSLGGTPEINTKDGVPTYPGPLPGDVRPQLEVALVGLSKEVVEKMYMEIEMPEHGPIALFRAIAIPTIGDFYDKVLEAFQRLRPEEITGARQIPRGPKLFEIKTFDDAKNAITRIKNQGEGAEQGAVQTPFSDPARKVLAHYYKFAVILHEHELVQNAAGKFVFEGTEVRFPHPDEIFPMAKVPLGGYPESEKFDKLFTSMLDHLQRAWADGNPQELETAIDIMRDELADPARELMRKTITGGTGNFGPDFRLVK
jgi:hypothetical protein